MDNILNLSSGETEVYFKITGLGNGIESRDEKWFCWCLLNIYIKNRYFCYDKTDDEVLTLGEVEYLRVTLNNLLNDRIIEKTSIRFIEPDLEFVLFPKYNLRESKDNIWVKEGMEIIDISVYFIIHLSDMKDGYNGQLFSLPFERIEIEKLKCYLDEAIILLNTHWDNYNR